MPRRGHIVRRAPRPDANYGSPVIQRFINCMMTRGKKSTAERIVYGALELAQSRLKKEPLEIFLQALKNVTPLIEVKPRRVGGATYQVPVEVKGERGQALAIRWLIMYSRKRSGKSMIEKLAGEFSDAANNTGASVKKREDTHKMAEANRAFAHYRY
jgi:small subunit ribosomal protein S7